MMLLNTVMTNMLIAITMASLLGSVAGSYIAIKNMRSIAGSINHAIFGGIGFTIFISDITNINIPPFVGASLSVIVSTIMLTRAHTLSKETEDSVSSAIWTIGSATGLLFASLAKNGSIKLLETVAGSLLYTTTEDLMSLSCITTIVLGLIYIYYYHINLMCIDENFAKTLKINTQNTYALLTFIFGMASAAIAMMMGTLMSLSFLLIPASIALKHSNNIHETMINSFIVSMTCSIIGVFLAYTTYASTSACISLTFGIMYCVHYMLEKRQNQRP